MLGLVLLIHSTEVTDCHILSGYPISDGIRYFKFFVIEEFFPKIYQLESNF